MTVSVRAEVGDLGSRNVGLCYIGPFDLTEMIGRRYSLGFALKKTLACGM